MKDGQTLIRARAAVAGMLPGQVDWRPTKRAEELIDGGYAVRAETLSERQASEPPNRHLDRQPSNQTGGTLGPDANPIPGGPLVARGLLPDKVQVSDETLRVLTGDED